MSHLPSPWEYDDESGEVIASKVGCEISVPAIVCSVPSMEHYSQAQTGRLLAAAPDLLAALLGLVERGTDSPQHLAAEAALKKAGV